MRITFRLKKYMSVLEQAQEFVSEHAFTIGVGFLVAVLIAAAAWFWISRSSSKSPVLENQARVNEATTTNSNTETDEPTQEQLEEMARYREQMETQQQAQGDNQMSPVQSE